MSLPIPSAESSPSTPWSGSRFELEESWNPLKVSAFAPALDHANEPESLS